MGQLNCGTNTCCTKEDASNTIIDDLKESGDKDSDDDIEIKREINKLKNDLISVRSHNNCDMSMDSTFGCANDLLQYKKNESKKHLFIKIYCFIIYK